MNTNAGPPRPENAETLISISVSGNIMLPLYRHGDTLLVSPDAPVKFGDRVVLESRTAGWLGGTLLHHGKEHTVLMRGGNPSREIAVPSSEVSFMGRIVWASQ